MTSPKWAIRAGIQAIQSVEKCKKGGSCKKWGWKTSERKNYQKI